MALQRSNYLTIETKPQEGHVHTSEDQGQVLASIEDNPINLRFCKVDEVNQKQHRLEQFKMTYMAQ